MGRGISRKARPGSPGHAAAGTREGVETGRRCEARAGGARKSCKAPRKREGVVFLLMGRVHAPTLQGHGAHPRRRSATVRDLRPRGGRLRAGLRPAPLPAPDLGVSARAGSSSPARSTPPAEAASVRTIRGESVRRRFRAHSAERPAAPVRSASAPASTDRTRGSRAREPGAPLASERAPASILLGRFADGPLRVPAGPPADRAVPPNPQPPPP